MPLSVTSVIVSFDPTIARFVTQTSAISSSASTIDSYTPGNAPICPVRRLQIVLGYGNTPYALRSLYGRHSALADDAHATRPRGIDFDPNIKHLV